MSTAGQGWLQVRLRPVCGRRLGQHRHPAVHRRTGCWPEDVPERHVLHPQDGQRLPLDGGGPSNSNFIATYKKNISVVFLLFFGVCLVVFFPASDSLKSVCFS